MKSPSAHISHLPITAATLMQILKRAELVCKLCIAMAMQTGRNPFFIERHCRLGYPECNACNIKRKESQGENQTDSNSLKSNRKSSKTMLEKFVLFAGSGLSVGLCSSQYVAGDKRRRVCVGATHMKKSHIHKHTH